MPTTSTVPAVKAALVELVGAEAPTEQVSYWWPGPTTSNRGIWLGDTEGEAGVANLKAARQHRTEVFYITVIVQSFEAGRANPAQAPEGEAEAFELLAHLENVLADDPTLSGACKVAELAGWESQVIPFETGVAVRITALVKVTARLT